MRAGITACPKKNPSAKGVDVPGPPSPPLALPSGRRRPLRRARLSQVPVPRRQLDRPYHRLRRPTRDASPASVGVEAHLAAMACATPPEHAVIASLRTSVRALFDPSTYAPCAADAPLARGTGLLAGTAGRRMTR